MIDASIVIESCQNGSLKSFAPQAGLIYDGTINSATIIFYKYSNENWAGIGVKGNGTPVIRIGTSNTNKVEYTFGNDGYIYANSRKI